MKIFWILLILTGISTWYIPTLAKFSGQHSYYDTNPKGNQIPCEKCHGDINIEIHNGYIHKNLTCSDCHRIMKGVQYASGDDNTTPGTLAHAASLVQCSECHGPFLNNVSDTIHESFIKYGMEKNTSENCISCHSAIAVSINWTRPSTLIIDTISNGSNFAITNATLGIMTRVETFGNKSGDVIAITNVTIE